MQQSNSQYSLSEKPTYLQAYHLSSNSLYGLMNKRSMQHKADLSLNLSQQINRRDTSRATDQVSEFAEASCDFSAGVLLARTKLLKEIFTSRENHLLQDLENDQLQVSSLESNLKSITQSVKFLKEAAIGALSSRTKNATQRRSPRIDLDPQEFANAFKDFLEERNTKIKEMDQLKQRLTSPRSISSSKILDLSSNQHPNPYLQAISKPKLLNNNLSADSQLLMNLSHPTISDQAQDQIDPTLISKSSQKKLVGSTSYKNWRNLYAGNEFSSSYKAEDEPNIVVSRLKLNTEQKPSLSPSFTAKVETNLKGIQGSFSNRVLDLQSGNEAFLTQRVIRTPDFQEVVASAKQKSLTPRQQLTKARPMLHQLTSSLLLGGKIPRSPRVESFMSKIETLVGSQSAGKIPITQEVSRQKKSTKLVEQATSKKDIPMPRITTLKLSPNPVIYGPGKKLKLSFTEISTPTKSKRAHALKDSNVTPLSVIEEHSTTSQVGTIFKDSPRRNVNDIYSKLGEASASRSKSHLSTEHAKFMKKAGSQDSAGLENATYSSKLLMSVDTGSIPYGNKRVLKTVHKSHNQELNSPTKISKENRNSVEKRSHKLLFESMNEGSYSADRDQTSLNQRQFSELDPNIQIEDPSMSLTKRELEDLRKASSPGIVRASPPAPKKEQPPGINTSLEGHLNNTDQSGKSSNSPYFKFNSLRITKDVQQSSD
jgi:uncharacterized protein YoxC